MNIDILLILYFLNDFIMLIRKKKEIDPLPLTGLTSLGPVLVSTHIGFITLISCSVKSFDEQGSEQVDIL